MSTITCSGGLFLSKDTKRFLFLLRNKGKTAKTWGFVGGKKDPIDLTPYDTLTREIREEIGFLPNIEKLIPLEQYTSQDQKFNYNTYILYLDIQWTILPIATPKTSLSDTNVCPPWALVGSLGQGYS